MTTARTNFEPLWRWVRERETIRTLKEGGVPPPWTECPILGKFRFCNVRREDDTVTRWIDQHVRTPYADHPHLWFMLCMSRVLNWPDTLAELQANDKTWPVRVDAFSLPEVARVLVDRAERGDKVFTGAYTIQAPPQRGTRKANYVADVVLGDLWRRRHQFSGSWKSLTLQGVHAWVMESNGWGPFMAYQAVVDMRFCEHLLAHAADRETWAAAGPGTIRGLHRVHGRNLHAPLPQDLALREILEIFPLVEPTTGVRVDLSDVPNLLCETDKYLRVQSGEGRPRATYTPSRSPAEDPAPPGNCTNPTGGDRS